VAPEVAGAGTDKGAADAKVNSSKQVTRNYEVDRTVSHTKLATGTVRRLSVAVVVDDRQVINQDGQSERQPLTPEEVERITGLVKEAVGFKAERGDSVNVVNVSFQDLEAVEEVPEVPVWKEPWFWELAKQMLGGLAILMVIFGVLRPLLNNLAQRGQTAMVPAGGPADELEEEVYDQERVSLAAAERHAQLAGPSQGDLQLEAVKNVVAQDPKIVAQVVKGWVSTDV